MRAELPAALVDEIEAANREAVCPDALHDLLTRHRAGDPSARQHLIDGLRHLAYAIAFRGSRFRSELVAKLWEGLAIAVDRLARNRVSNVAQFVRDELNRTVREAYAEDSPTIRPAASTNSTRRKAGKAEHAAMKKSASIDPHHRPKCGETDHNPIDTSHPGGMAEMLDTFCRTSEEEDVARMLVDGYDYRTIAATLSISKARVESTVALFRRRAEQAGLAWVDRRAA
jgi:hypothetical protein